MTTRKGPSAPQLVILAGPLAAGKNAVADHLAELLTDRCHTVIAASPTWRQWSRRPARAKPVFGSPHTKPTSVQPMSREPRNMQPGCVSPTRRNDGSSRQDVEQVG
jgi:hypothetical protein